MIFRRSNKKSILNICYFMSIIHISSYAKLFSCKHIDDGVNLVSCKTMRTLKRVGTEDIRWTELKTVVSKSQNKNLEYVLSYRRNRVVQKL